MLILADVNHFLLGLEPWWTQELLNIERRSANRRSVARFLNDESKVDSANQRPLGYAIGSSVLAGWYGI